MRNQETYIIYNEILVGFRGSSRPSLELMSIVPRQLIQLNIISGSRLASEDPLRLKEFLIPTLCPMALLGTFCPTTELHLLVALAVSTLELHLQVALAVSQLLLGTKLK